MTGSSVRPSMRARALRCVSVVLVEDDQGSNHTGNPAGASKKQYYKERSAAFVYDSERRKND